MPYVLTRFGFNEMMDCRRRVRMLFEEPPMTLSEAAGRIVQFFYENLVDDEGRPACALVRFFKTYPFELLSAELQSFARRIAFEGAVLSSTRCLTLVATIGDRPEWRSPELSRGHRAIPLTSVEMVEQAPMISQLIRQMGLSIASVVRPDPNLMLDRGEKTYNVFHVARAAGSPFIPAQEEFVSPFGIESVLGFGGLVSTGDMFATIMFSRVPISPAVADAFKVVGLNMKIAILPFVGLPLFESE